MPLSATIGRPGLQYDTRVSECLTCRAYAPVLSAPFQGSPLSSGPWPLLPSAVFGRSSVYIAGPIGQPYYADTLSLWHPNACRHLPLNRGTPAFVALAPPLLLSRGRTRARLRAAPGPALETRPILAVRKERAGGGGDAWEGGEGEGTPQRSQALSAPCPPPPSAASAGCAAAQRLDATAAPRTGRRRAAAGEAPASAEAALPAAQGAPLPPTRPIELERPPGLRVDHTAPIIPPPPHPHPPFPYPHPTPIT